jgi:hypothetical protein
MAALGRNDPCPCGSGRKVKKCHPDGLAQRRWSLAGASDLSEDPASLPDEGIEGDDPGGTPPDAAEVMGEDGFEEPFGRRERVRIQAPLPGPEGLRISREILDADLGAGDLEAIRVALNGKIQSHRAVELARAQASIRVGMRVTYPGRDGPREGVVHDVRRTRAVVCSGSDSWMVSLALLRPAASADQGPAAVPG